MSENGRDAKPRGGYERQNGHRPAMNGNGNGNGVHRYDDDEEDPDYVHHFDLKAARGRLMDSAKNFKPPSKPVLHVEPKDLIKLKALTFDDMDLPEELAEGLRTTNYTTPTPVQSIGIPAGLEGNDVLTVAQTGSGKTLCFLLVMGASLIDKKAKRGPLNAIEPLGLAFTPTRELALQIMEVACTVYEYTPLRVCGAYGGIRQQKLLEEFEDQCRRRKLDAAVDILVGCPGRVQDLADRRKLLLERISFLVLDEADRLLDMGFQSQMDSIVLHSNMPRDRQTLFYSATFDQKELQFAKGYLKDDHAFVRQGVDRTLPDSLDVQFYDIAKGRETVGMVQSIVKDAKHQTLIFVGTKVDARAWGRELRCLVLHGDMTQAAREKSLESFRNDESTVLVATDVAQRGLDVPEVTDVVCVTLPNNEDDFLHRAGRTARCGRSGIMHLLIDRPTASLPAIVNVVEDSGIDV
ncbi:DEAD-box ATP-dependent RNA helicase 52C, partial [Diplonema papillatum]